MNLGKKAKCGIPRIWDSPLLHKTPDWECRKKPVQTIISYSGDAGLLKIRVIYFLVNLSGHNYLVFQDRLTPIWSCSSPFTRLPVIQGHSCPAFPIIISPSAWYCRPWSLTAYGYAPGLNRGNDTSSIRNIWSDRPPFVRFYSDYGRLVSLLQLLAFVSPAESMAHNSWCKLFWPAPLKQYQI